MTLISTSRLSVMTLWQLYQLYQLNSCILDMRVWMIKNKNKLMTPKQNSLFADLHKLNKISAVCQSA